MVKRKLGKVIGRVFKKEFKKQDTKWQKKYGFLTDVPFYALTDFQLPGSKKRQVRVEFTIKSIKKIVELAFKGKQFQKENEQLTTQLNDLAQRLSVLEDKCARLEFNNTQLLKNIEDGTPPDDFPIPSGIAGVGKSTHIIPFQGGAPGSGKKS